MINPSTELDLAGLAQVSCRRVSWVPAGIWLDGVKGGLCRTGPGQNSKPLTSLPLPATPSFPVFYYIVSSKT